MKQTRATWCTLVGVALLSGAVEAVVMAIDFSRSETRAAQPVLRAISHETETAFCGELDGWSFRYHITKAWNGELPGWPSVNLKPDVTDWRGYDRLVVDVCDKGEVGNDSLALFVGGKGNRKRLGLRSENLILHGGGGFSRWVVDLRKMSDFTDPARIDYVHLFSARPCSADAHLGNFLLLKPGEPLPPLPKAYDAWLERRRQARDQACRVRHAKSCEAFRAVCEKTGAAYPRFYLGQATGAEKVSPRDEFAVQAASRVDLRLARGEYESAQLLVLPRGGDLTNVQVRASALVTEKGTVLPAEAVKTWVTGYVETKWMPPNKRAHNVSTNLPGGYVRVLEQQRLGWYAEPILSYTNAADVVGDDLQSFWIRVQAPRDQEPGVYSGRLSVAAEGVAEVSLPFSVRVNSFTLSPGAPYPIAIAFFPAPRQYDDLPETVDQAKRQRDSKDNPVKLWLKHATEWIDFLADYYITTDSIYQRTIPDIATFKRLEAQGRLGWVNVGYWDYPKSLSILDKLAWRRTTGARLRKSYALLKEAGLLHRAYVYGCDEVKKEYFPLVQWAVAEVKEACPGVPLVTTSYDTEYGVGTPLSGIDVFTPTTDRYDIGKAARSRAEGHRVWWYSACNPLPPYANLFIENQAIEQRLIMGALCVKAQADGYLYYNISIWNAEHPVTGGPFTDWEPRTFRVWNGDGCWTSCGPDGIPLPTVRLENFRDGVEDYQYARLYFEKFGRWPDVGVDIVRDWANFTDDPKVLRHWRDAIADALEK